MPNYEIEFTGKVQEWGNVELEADNPEQAEEFAREHILEVYPEYEDIEIEAIKELNK
jgi:hypothetical protein